MTVTAFIPARWNSSRLLHKNYLPCAGESLVSRAIRVAVAARDIGLVQHVFVSADENVTSAGVDAAHYCEWQSRGVQVIYRRAWDDRDLRSTDITVSQLLAGLIRHGFPELDADLFCILLPTSPLRTLRHLVESRLLLRPETDVVMSVTPIKANLRYALCEDEGGLGRLDSAQWPESLRPLIHDGTAIWCTRRIAKSGVGFYDWAKVAAYRVPPEEAVDVNTQLDLDIAEFLLRRREGLMAGSPNLPGGQNP